MREKDGPASVGPLTLNPQPSNKVLVVIQLSGGNDGLNTVVPYGNDAYYRVRSTISVPSDEIIKLNEVQGLNPAMAIASTKRMMAERG